MLITTILLNPAIILTQNRDIVPPALPTWRPAGGPRPDLPRLRHPGEGRASRGRRFCPRTVAIHRPTRTGRIGDARARVRIVRETLPKSRLRSIEIVSRRLPGMRNVNAFRCHHL